METDDVLDRFDFILWEIVSQYCEPNILIALAHVNYSMHIFIKNLAKWDSLKYTMHNISLGSAERLPTFNSSGVGPISLSNRNFWSLPFRKQCLTLSHYPVTGDVEQCWEFICSSQFLLEIACTVVWGKDSTHYWRSGYNPAEQWPCVVENNQAFQLKNNKRTLLPSAPGQPLPPSYCVGLSSEQDANWKDYKTIAQVVEGFSGLLFGLKIMKVNQQKLPPVSQYYFDLPEPTDDEWENYPLSHLKYVELVFPNGLHIPYVKTPIPPDINMLCPISGLEILLPVLSVRCEHFACFDLTNFVRHARQTKSWRCPICNIDVRPPNKLILIRPEFLDKL